MFIFLPCLNGTRTLLEPHQPQSHIPEAIEIERHYEDPFDLSMIRYVSQIVPSITGAQNVQAKQSNWRPATSPELIEAANRALATWFKRFGQTGKI